MIYVQLSEKLLPLKRRKVVPEEENCKKKWQGEISKTRSLDEKIYRKDKLESQVIRKR